jgi:ankyrin repeat protein
MVLLLRKWHDVDHKDMDGRTPLSWAAQFGNNHIVNLLLTKGANLTLKDNKAGLLR